MNGVNSTASTLNHHIILAHNQIRNKVERLDLFDTTCITNARHENKTSCMTIIAWIILI